MRSAALWLSSARADDPEGLFGLGLIFETGDWGFTAQDLAAAAASPRLGPCPEAAAPLAALFSGEWGEGEGAAGEASSAGAVPEASGDPLAARGAEEAARLYARASGRGHAQAAINLAHMYEDGRGVAKEPELAAAYFSLAQSLRTGGALSAKQTKKGAKTGTSFFEKVFAGKATSGKARESGGVSPPGSVAGAAKPKKKKSVGWLLSSSSRLDSSRPPTREATAPRPPGAARASGSAAAGRGEGHVEGHVEGQDPGASSPSPPPSSPSPPLEGRVRGDPEACAAGEQPAAGEQENRGFATWQVAAAVAEAEALPSREPPSRKGPPTSSRSFSEIVGLKSFHF